MKESLPDAVLVVWSLVGPVLVVEVDPLFQVQSKLSVLSFFHSQRLEDSKSHVTEDGLGVAPGETVLWPKQEEI